MMSTERELEASILLQALLCGAAAHEAVCLLRSTLSPEELIGRVAAENLWGKAEALAELRKKLDPRREMEECRKKGIRLLTLSDPGYPAMLREIYDPPLLLYMKGAWLSADDAALAVIGSRHPTTYGLLQARRFAAELSAAGWTIVSGLARGIDQSAHEGALEISHGRTAAVLGSGLDVMYPRENQRLFERIQERGAVFSELPLGSQPLAHHFPRRNRIISGLSLGVLVVEAHLKSGSLITAKEALDQGREVFAMPGRIDQITSFGTHQLLKDGACLADSSASILEVLGNAYRHRPVETSGIPVPVEISAGLPQPAEEDFEDQAVLQVLRSEGPLCFDELESRQVVSGSRLSSRLLKMELDGRLKKQSDGRFCARRADT